MSDREIEVQRQILDVLLAILGETTRVRCMLQTSSIVNIRYWQHDWDAAASYSRPAIEPDSDKSK